MEYNCFTWWISTKVKPLAFRIWRYVSMPINFLALVLFISVYHEYIKMYFLIVFLPVFVIDIVWDMFNFFSYSRDKLDEIKVAESGEKPVEGISEVDEYDLEKFQQKIAADNRISAENAEHEIVFEDKKKIEKSKSVLSQIKALLSFSTTEEQNETILEKERKRELKLQNRYDIKLQKSKRDKD